MLIYASDQPISGVCSVEVNALQWYVAATSVVNICLTLTTITVTIISNIRSTRVIMIFTADGSAVCNLEPTERK